MKKLLLITFCLVFVPLGVSAQVASTSTMDEIPRVVPVLPVFPLPVDEEPEPPPPPAPVQEEAATPATEEAVNTPPTDAPATGASADPNVLAVQNSSPTAGAGNVYRGNTLSRTSTQLLLALALACGVGGLVLSNAHVLRRTLAPAQPARAGA